MSISHCVICGSNELGHRDVLWQELVEAWQLSEHEVGYINRQQGFFCKKCGNNLRSMALASAILHTYKAHGLFSEFSESNLDLKLLEINTAGNLTQYFRKMPGHRLIEYPQFDMTNLLINSDEFDLVVHSDTLEHVPFAERALSECRRVLRSGGHCIFTIPIIVNRMTRTRTGLAPSYHGQSGVAAQDQLVYSEFGANFWVQVLKAGFATCEIYSFEYPSALVVIAKK